MTTYFQPESLLRKPKGSPTGGTSCTLKVTDPTRNNCPWKKKKVKNMTRRKGVKSGGREKRQRGRETMGE